MPRSRPACRSRRLQPAAAAQGWPASAAPAAASVAAAAEGLPAAAAASAPQCSAGPSPGSAYGRPVLPLLPGCDCGCACSSSGGRQHHQCFRPSAGQHAAAGAAAAGAAAAVPLKASVFPQFASTSVHGFCSYCAAFWATCCVSAPSPAVLTAIPLLQCLKDSLITHNKSDGEGTQSIAYNERRPSSEPAVQLRRQAGKGTAGPLAASNHLRES